MAEITSTPIADSNDNLLQLSLPQKEGRSGILTSFLIGRNELLHIIKDYQGANDRRLLYGTKLLIGYIDDDTYRRDLYQRFNDRIKEIGDSNTSADRKVGEVLDETIYILGEITSYFDRTVGFSHKLEVRLL